MDDTSLITLVLAAASILSNIILHYKLKHCHSLCCSSDCINTPTNTPATTPLTLSPKPSYTDV